MKLCTGSIFLIFLLFNLQLNAQYNFNSGFETADPTNDFEEVELVDKMAIHEAFLTKALADTSALTKVYAYVYLYYDYLRANDFSTAADYLIKAEHIVEDSGKPGWKGWIRQRRAILEVILDNRENALEVYKESILLCRQSGDSLCVAKGLEQMGSMYAQMDSFDISKVYFERAFPLLETYAPTLTKGISYNNYGILLSRQGQPREAIEYMDRAVDIFTEEKEYLKAGKAMNNLADAHRRLGEYLEAEDGFLKTIEFNKSHGLDENLIRNYLGLSETYDESGNYKASKQYLERFYDLKDSLVGAETKLKIEKLESDYELQEKELELSKSKEELILANRAVERFFGYGTLILLLGAFLIWRWYLQRKQTKEALEENKRNLKELTNLLLEKNSKIIEFEEKLEKSNVSKSKSNSDDVPFYNERVLTEDDWTSFKLKFDRSYPNYRKRLRQQHPNLTDGEERLYLFIKLNLSTAETATILGISKESVKKNRYRLRKKLELTTEDSLEDLVQTF
ncbi:tetratricopeptide repeat protein [Portibacter lacus]|uniref:Tetratricopeptide repeat protein n=1 Tax=Portibacter lacus TaxID=1099794 RepID=A0AA37WD78_9BACT|nr:transcriptional regulator [Portibacter lacus]GLR15612.1 hypothetical protein GCM10007940_02270 [Portibacter lacus]